LSVQNNIRETRNFRKRAAANQTVQKSCRRNLQVTYFCWRQHTRTTVKPKISNNEPFLCCCYLYLLDSKTCRSDKGRSYSKSSTDPKTLVFSGIPFKISIGSQSQANQNPRYGEAGEPHLVFWPNSPSLTKSFGTTHVGSRSTPLHHGMSDLLTSSLVGYC
jgi:hypothetical protein